MRSAPPSLLQRYTPWWFYPNPEGRTVAVIPAARRAALPPPDKYKDLFSRSLTDVFRKRFGAKGKIPQSAIIRSFLGLTKRVDWISYNSSMLYLPFAIPCRDMRMISSTGSDR